VNLVALYARVSKDRCRKCGKTEEQHAGEDHDFHGQDPEAQLQPLRQYCKERGWTIAREFIDEGWSGAKASRPALDELMAAVDAKTRGFEGVVVWKFDRFFRSTQHMLRVLELFQKKDLEFISTTEQIDTSTPVGKLVFTLLAAIAEFERELMRERIRNGMKKAGAKKPGPKIGDRGPSRSTRYRRAAQARASTALPSATPAS
jgi:DNA invertase Pin-like site-specific DNA recombinase